MWTKATLALREGEALVPQPLRCPALFLFMVAVPEQLAMAIHVAVSGLIWCSTLLE